MRDCGLLLVKQMLWKLLEVWMRWRGLCILLLQLRLVLEVLPSIPGLHLAGELDDLLVSATDLLDGFIADVFR